MAPLAELYAKKNYSVSGSDLHHNKNCEFLKKAGCKIYNHHNYDLNDVDTVVYSSAISNSNPEIIQAKQKNLKILHRSDLLKETLNDARISITISGTHGKTTTTALIGHILKNEHLFPTILMGSYYNNQKNLVEYPDSNIIVAESDESDGTFLKYSPHIAVITNIDEDHLDYFKTKENIITHFTQHIQNIKQGGWLVFNADCPLSIEVSKHYNGNKISFGFSESADLHCINFNQKGQQTSIQLRLSQEKINSILPIFGEHNISNIMAAVCVHQILTKRFATSLKNLMDWPGIGKRQSIILSNEKLTIIDDYAHNPQKINSLLKSIKAAWPEQKIYAVFEPHRYSRLKNLRQNFAHSFNHVNCVLLLPVFAAGEIDEENYNPAQFAKEIEISSETKVIYVNSSSEIYDIIRNEFMKRHLILPIIGAGFSSNIAEEVKRLYFADQNL